MKLMIFLLFSVLLITSPIKGQYRELSWSPSGDQIAFSSTLDGDSEIFIVDKDGANLKKLTDNTSSDLNAEWTPDGKSIVFTSDQTGKSQIFIMNSDGSNPVNLTKTDSEEWHGRLSPDGKKVLFMTTRHEFGQLYTIDIDGSNPTRITNTKSATTQATWAYNSTIIVFTDIDAFRTKEDKSIQMIGSIENKKFRPLFQRVTTATTVLDWVSPEKCLIQEKYREATDQFGLKPPEFKSVVYIYDISSAKKSKIIKNADNINSLRISPKNENKMIFISGGPPAMDFRYSAYYFDRDNKKPIKIADDIRFAEWSPNGDYIALSDGKYIAITDSGGQNLKFLNK